MRQKWRKLPRGISLETHCFREPYALKTHTNTDRHKDGASVGGPRDLVTAARLHTNSSQLRTQVRDSWLRHLSGRRWKDTAVSVYLSIHAFSQCALTEQLLSTRKGAKARGFRAKTVLAL